MTTTTKSRRTTRAVPRIIPSKPIPALKAPHYEIVAVTPELAKSWLERNTHNVDLRSRIVERYSRDMANGDWLMRGDAIEFSPDGVLLNGQHRLNALIKADVTVNLLIGTNIPAAVQTVTDSGRGRTYGDHLKLSGRKEASIVAAIARRMCIWDAGYTGFQFNNNSYMPTNSELDNWCDKNPIIDHAAAISHALSSNIGIAPSVVGAAYILFSRVDEEDALEFVARLADGANQEPGSPILVLRSRVIRERMLGSRLTQSEWLSLLISAWNAWRERRLVTKLQINRTNFPMPV